MNKYDIEEWTEVHYYNHFCKSLFSAGLLTSPGRSDPHFAVLGAGAGSENEKLENFCGSGSEKLGPSATLLLSIPR